MICPNCKNQLPDGALHCNICGISIAVYRAPDGFVPDPGGSGLYYRTDTVSDPATGVSVQWVTWFNPQTGTYEQVQTPQPQPAAPPPKPAPPPPPRQAAPPPKPAPPPPPRQAAPPPKPAPPPPPRQAAPPSAQTPPTNAAPVKSSRAGIIMMVAVPVLALLVGIGIAIIQTGGFYTYEHSETVSSSIRLGDIPTASDSVAQDSNSGVMNEAGLNASHSPEFNAYIIGTADIDDTDIDQFFSPSISYNVGVPFTLTVDFSPDSILYNDPSIGYHFLMIQTDAMDQNAMYDVHIDSIIVDGRSISIITENIPAQTYDAFTNDANGVDYGFSIILTSSSHYTPIIENVNDIETFTKLEITLAIVEPGAANPFDGT